MSVYYLRFKRWLFSREGALVAALVLVAAAIRLPLMAFHGYYSDLATYIGWGDAVNQHFTSIYSAATTTTGTGGFGGTGGGRFPGGTGGFGGNGGGFGGGTGGTGGTGGNGGFGGFGAATSINYPPATPYLFGLVVFLANHLLLNGSGATLSALIRQDGAGPFIAKLPLLLADLAAIGLLYWQARKRHSHRFALVVAAIYALSPAVLYNGAAWGQTDAFVALPVLLALFALVSERYVLGGVALAVAVLIKPQPVIFVPLVLLYLWRWASREQFVRFVAGGLGAALVLLLPVMVPNFQLGTMLGNMQALSYNDSLSLSSDAFNFWWLIGYGSQPMSSTLLGVRAGLVGDALFAGVTLLVAVVIWRHREPVYLAFGLAVQLFGFFLFMGGQHERYLFLFIPLALASLIFVRREQSGHLVALYVAGTALCFLNMLVGVGGGIGSFGSIQPIPFLNTPVLNTYLSTNFSGLSETIALLHVVTFAYALYVYLGGHFQPIERTSQPQPELQSSDAMQPQPVIS